MARSLLLILLSASTAAMGATPAHRTAPIRHAVRAKVRPAGGAKKSDEPANPEQNGIRRMGDMAQVFGWVKAVRGKVLQMSTPGGKGLTRVIIQPNAMVQKQSTVAVTTLAPGVPVMGSGLADGDASDEPTHLTVNSLRLMDGPGGREGFGPPDSGWRGRTGRTFRHSNYSGTWSFQGKIASVNPLRIVDDNGRPLPVEVAPTLTVNRNEVRPYREGDIASNSMVIAVGKTTPDGLVNAQFLALLDQGNGVQTFTGPLLQVNTNAVTIRPRFENGPVTIKRTADSRVYRQTNLDLDALQAGAEVDIAGTVIAGTAEQPTGLVARVIAPAGSSIPKFDLGGGGGGFWRGQSIKARVHGTLDSLDPPTLKTGDGRTISLVIPGQMIYARFEPASASDLKAGERTLIIARTGENGQTLEGAVLSPGSTLEDAL